MFNKKKKENFTRVGTPVRVINPNGSIHAGLISRVQGSEVDIWVFPNTGASPILATNVRNIDFRKEGESFWDFPAKDYCYAEHVFKYKK